MSGNTEKKCARTCDPTRQQPANLQDELRNVIDLMGPETPNMRSGSDEDANRDSTVLNTDQEKREEMKLAPVAEDINSVPNTPKDFSELSSFPTDSVDVYIEQKSCSCIEQYKIKSNDVIGAPYSIYRSTKQVSKKDVSAGPIKKISSFLGFTPTLPCTSNQSKKDLGVDLYRINILQPKDETSAPKRVIFDRVEELPKPFCINAATNTSLCTSYFGFKKNSGVEITSNMNVHSSNEQSCHCYKSVQTGSNYKSTTVVNQSPGSERKWQRQTFYETHDVQAPPGGNYNNMSRVDVYYFDHGNSAYYHTTDSPPVIMTEILAERTEHTTTKFWAEMFGTITIGISFFTSFIIQLFRFILQSFVRPLIIGLVQMLSDYCFKPFLATIFNAVLQPPLIFLFNLSTSLRDILDPLAEGVGFILRELAVVFKAFRIIEVKKEIKTDCHCCASRKMAVAYCDKDNCHLKSGTIV